MTDLLRDLGRFIELSAGIANVTVIIDSCSVPSTTDVQIDHQRAGGTPLKLKLDEITRQSLFYTIIFEPLPTLLLTRRVGPASTIHRSRCLRRQLFSVRVGRLTGTSRAGDRRGYAKRITKGVLLPQGLQSPLPPISTSRSRKGSDNRDDPASVEDGQDNSTKTLQYSTVLQGALNNIQRYPHCVLLTRVGGFYELYFNHAEDLHQELGLKRSYRDTKLGPVAMAGFPWFQLDRYLKVLVGEMSLNVAISEEYARESGPNGSAPVDLNNKNLFDRRVSRIITPGTLIDEKFMETERSSYLLSIYRPPAQVDATVGLAWTDLSTGEFFVQEVEDVTFISHIQRLQPKEIITSIENLVLPSAVVVTRVPMISSVSEHWTSLTSKETPDFTNLEVLAGSTLLNYVAANLPETVISSLPPTRRKESDVVTLDSNALYSLEIRASMREQTVRGSLLHAMRRTTTKSGTRLLSEWLISPITSITALEKRLDLVELLIEEPGLKVEVIRYLKDSGDAVRVLQRFGFGRGEVDDLLTITKAIAATSELLATLQTHDRASSLTSRMSVLHSLRKKISSSIDEAGLTKRNREDAESAAAMMEDVLGAMSGSSKPIERRRKAIERDLTYTMRPAASTALRQMHKNLEQMGLEKQELETRLRQESGMSSLTLKTLPGLSHIIHVKGTDTKTDMTTMKFEMRSVGSTRSTRSYHFAEWSYLGTRIEAEKIRIQQEEARTFHQLRQEVLRHSQVLRQNARVLDELDVASCFASIALENNWIRPTLTHDKTTRIVDGRHPVVEFALRARGVPFTPNSISFDDEAMMYLVTGTNMGGKSTFLRQMAILQILAQVGSFIPAKSASIGLVNAIYSRLGSNDNLFLNQSTFMCEMQETASILKQATSSSLVLMDEVGRGTTPVDGTAIAYACLQALSSVGCKTLFATHFYELADLARASTSTASSDTRTIKCGLLYTDIVSDDDEGGGFSFSHEIKRGVCRDSHGLKIAQLAGMPSSVLHTAKTMQAQLLRKH